MEEVKEYITFTITTKDGNEAELAVVEEFEYKNKHYVAAALIEEDMIHEDAVYIYRIKEGQEEFEVEKITNAIEYQEIAKAYSEM